jgi:hypothetical protein
MSFLGWALGVTKITSASRLLGLHLQADAMPASGAINQGEKAALGTTASPAALKDPAFTTCRRPSNRRNR